MKVFVASLVLAAACLFAAAMSGCTVQKSFVTAVDASWSVIGPEYIGYVEADTALDARSRDIRIRTATLLTETIEEAKK